MLVSSIARFQATAGIHDAGFAMMMNTNSMMNLVRNAGNYANIQSFGGEGGEHNLTALHEADKRLSLDMLTNSLLYKIYDLQEKMWKKQQDADIKRSFSTFA